MLSQLHRLKQRVKASSRGESQTLTKEAKQRRREMLEDMREQEQEGVLGAAASRAEDTRVAVDGGDTWRQKKSEESYAQASRRYAEWRSRANKQLEDVDAP